MTFKKTLISLSLTATLALTGCGSSGSGSSAGAGTAVKDLGDKKVSTIKAALTAYADGAIAGYQAAGSDAIAMRNAIKAFTDAPSDSTMTAAKNAWLKARESYGPTEAWRLSNGPIDAEDGFAASFGAPEGQLNAWPLDENYVDYTVTADGSRKNSGIIYGSAGINTALLSELNEKGGDANVASGYHAVEFLLWGQDQDYGNFIADNITHGSTTAGQRPLTDFTSDAKATRRKAYLNAAANLIVSDLASMINAWTTGGYKSALIGEGANAIPQNVALKQVFGGLGVFLKSEVANERIAVAALTPSEEDEHSCFSDNTHRDIALNYQGFKKALGYFSANLTSKAKSPIDSLIAKVDGQVKKINDVANSTHHFDYQIIGANGHLDNIVATKNTMRDLGDKMISVAAEYGVALGQGDVTDSEETEI